MNEMFIRCGVFFIVLVVFPVLVSAQSVDFQARQDTIKDQALRAYRTVNLDVAMPVISKTNVKGYPSCFVERLDDTKQTNFKTSADYMNSWLRRKIIE